MPVLSFYLATWPPVQSHLLLGSSLETELAGGPSQYPVHLFHLAWPSMRCSLEFPLAIVPQPPGDTNLLNVGPQPHLGAFHHWKRPLDMERSSLIMFLVSSLKRQVSADLSLCVSTLRAGQHWGWTPLPTLCHLSGKLQPYLLCLRI